MDKKRKKSLVGWTFNDWGMSMVEHKHVEGIYRIEHNMLFRTKQDACDMLRLPDGEYKPVEVRITIEEI